MKYAYTGTMPRVYPAYRDLATYQTLTAEPGGSYDMEPASGMESLAVPPGDGNWAEAPGPEESPVALAREHPAAATGDSAPASPEPAKTKAGARAPRGE